MNAIVDEPRTTRSQHAAVTADLARWYAGHPSIRRLRAIEEQLALRICIVLEPTSDGDDTLPVWLAYNRMWAHELRLLAGRDVQLQLLPHDAFEELSATADAAVVAEVSWRDSWTIP